MKNHDTPAVRIAALREGHRRCGMKHGQAGKVHEAGTFSRDEIDRLHADPKLVVVELTGSEPDEAPVTGDAGIDPAGDAISAWHVHGAGALGLFLDGLNPACIRASDPEAIRPELVAALADLLGMKPITPPGVEGDPDPDGSGAAGKGTQAGAEGREAMIARHAAAIVAGGDPAKLTKSGKPSTQALESATGLDDISAAERDAALAG